MKVKLLKKLRREIINNAQIHWLSQWSGYLSTTLKGVRYDGDFHGAIGFSINAESIGKELEHIALKGYVKSKRKN